MAGNNRLEDELKSRTCDMSAGFLENVFEVYEILAILVDREDCTLEAAILAINDWGAEQ